MAKNRDFSAEADAAVFASYDGLPVHEKMIKDEIRTKSYLNAMEDNPHLFKDKIVLDIGTETGILSMFAVRAGAKHVYATDVSNMIDNARKMAEVNNMSHKITFIKTRVEEAKLPMVDIIVEIMLDCLLYARDKFLVPDGLIWGEDEWQDWNNVYGLDFSPAKPAAISKGFLRTPDSSAVITKATCVLDLDLQTVQVSDSTLKSLPFQLAANRDDTVHAFLAWFDYEFTAGLEPVRVSTGPFSPPTHWKQTVFYLEKPVKMRKGQALTGEVSFEQYQRDLNVRFSYEYESSSANVSWAFYLFNRNLKSFNTEAHMICTCTYTEVVQI
ncbi:protein arginine N-methyltransferase 1 [Hyaloscypha finlandica]|nr:protein arginine N-methyltransferase 1 [Hyaloscypha finlandica]